MTCGGCRPCTLRLAGPHWLQNGTPCAYACTQPAPACRPGTNGPQTLYGDAGITLELERTPQLVATPSMTVFDSHSCLPRKRRRALSPADAHVAVWPVLVA